MRKTSIVAASLALTLCGSSTSLYAQNTPVIILRAAPHDAFDRVVFDWPRDTKFELHQEGAHAWINFDAAATIKLPTAALSDLTRAKGFATESDDQGHVTVSFSVDPQANLSSFTSDKSVVIDIKGKAASDVPAVKAAPPKEKAEVKPPVPEAQPASPPPPKTEEKVAQDKPEALLSAAAPASAAVEAPLPATPPATADKDTSPPPTDIPDHANPPPPAPETAKATPTIPLTDTPTLVATLDPHIATRAAIYQRADVGYVVFDRKLTFSAAQLEGDNPALIDLDVFNLPSNAAFRFPVPPNSQLQATLDGTVWKIFLVRKHPSMSVSTMLVSQPDFALGARFLLPLPDAPEPVRITDPVVGDDLILVPLAQSEAFNTERRTAEVDILPAAQGLVVKPLTDKVTVRAVSDGVEISAEGGLLLSQSTDTGATPRGQAKTKTAPPLKSIFDFTVWSGKKGENFTQTRQRLQQTIIDVPEAERDRARLELARFYFARGQGTEAVALLNMLVKKVPDMRSHGDFMALLGAAEIMAAHPEDGLRDLSLPALAQQPELELWQAVGLAQLRNWTQAEERFAGRENILSGYPEPFFSRFFVLAVESALAAGKDHEASDWLDYLTNTAHSPTADPAILYLQGVIQAKSGHAQAAKEAWKATQGMNDRLYKIRAELALIDLDVATGSLTPAQAADRLEALRFGWRGDDLEVDVLHRLGQFYIQAKNIKAGLNALSHAITLYPASGMTPAIRTEMASTFHDVFLGDLGKKLSPLDNLMLYQQYRDLMPTGHEGDVVMKNLAERLVAVDLLDQASGILEDLIKSHLQGEDKDRTILRLSAIRLLDHNPTEAMANLDMIGNDILSPVLQNERSLLRARALAELHRTDDATALLKDNDSPGAKALRADIAMRAQKWNDAGKALMDLVGPPPPAGTALTPEQALRLVNAAIAYALNNDQADLDRLAIDYGAGMAGSAQNDTFLMLTRPEKSGQLRDLAAATAQLTQVDMFQDFLNTYRKAEAAAPDVKP